MSNSQQTVADGVRAIISDQIPVDLEEITPGSLIREDLRADSLDFIEICMQCEEDFDIQIDDEEAENMKTVADLIALVERHVSQAGGTK